MEIQSQTRIPRPKGVTQLSRGGLIEQLHERLIDAYFMGSFPFNGQGLDLFSFSSLYQIPLKKVKAKVQLNLSEYPEVDKKDIRDALEKERWKLLGGVINRLGRADFETDRLLRFIGGKVYSSGIPDPLMVKEINSAITNQIRITEAEVKTIGMINQSLDSIPLEVKDMEERLTQAEALKYLSDIPRTSLDWAKSVEDTPDLGPIPEQKRKQLKEDFNKEASHDYDANPEIPAFDDYEDIPIMPR